MEPINTSIATNTTSPDPTEPILRTPVSEREVDLRHPTPDLQSIQGAYVSNIERLEDKAERMSTSGSELGEEIRKLQLEQKLSDSRQSSLLSGAGPEVARFQTRSRNASTSSYANSIVDLNSAARWGGYSPGGFVTSPLGSVNSGSWNTNRKRSTSRASRFGQMSNLDLQEEAQKDPTSAPRISSLKSSALSTEQHPLEEHEEDDDRPLSSYFNQPQQRGLHVVSHEQEDQQHGNNPGAEIDRPGSAGSGDTYQQARVLFRDFDGVHYGNDPDLSLRHPDAHEQDHNTHGEEQIAEDGREPEGIDEHGVQEQRQSHESSQSSRKSSNTRRVSRQSLMDPLPVPPPAVPPPSDDMVFYPAPVPRTLNLPKRLSQLPAATVQAKRRTQMLSGLPTDARKSAIWLNDEQRVEEAAPAAAPNRRSQMNLAALPPQLRASMYFDHQPVSQEVEVQGGSARDTLDHILEASATAPVSAFTDHPLAGHLGSEVYGKSTARKSLMALPDTQKAKETEKTEKPDRKSRTSQLFRKSSNDGLNKLQKRSSSRLSLALSSEFPKDNEHKDEAEEDGEQTPLRHSSEEEAVEHEEEPEEESEPQFFGPPTTLLAELQLRKEQQKTRTRTAAVAYPNGMHSTLLELDAVAQIEKQKRQTARVALAWEDPHAKAVEDKEKDDDDEVPLGMLFPGRDGLANKSSALGRLGRGEQPVGLIEKRAMEDNEPLSKRRNRLKGIEDRPTSHRQSTIPLTGVPSAEQVRASTPISPVPDTTDEPEHETETLAQRLRRLKDSARLSAALGSSDDRPVSAAFATELLSQLGAPDEEAPKPAPPDENETLGQRRARLQAEALARTRTATTTTDLLQPGGVNTAAAGTTRPPLRSAHSMADILAAHPTGNQSRKVSNEMLVDSLPRGSLLQVSEATRARQKKQLFDRNRGAADGGPLVDVRKDKDWDTPLGLLAPGGQAGMRQSSYGSMGMMGGNASVLNLAMQQQQQQQQMQMQMQMNAMNMQMNGMNPYGQPQMPGFPQQQYPQQMGMGMGMPMMNMGMPMMGMNGMNGMPMNIGMQMGMNNMPMNMQMAMQSTGDPEMDQRQRDMIDRWRQSVMP